MALKFQFEIITPERVVYKDEIDQVTLPTKQGEITILPHHTPLVAVLMPGEILVKKGTEEQAMACSGGFIEITPKKVVVLADTAEKVEELVEEQILEARKRAEKVLKEKKADREAFEIASATLERELARLKVLRKRSRSRLRPRPRVEE